MGLHVERIPTLSDNYSYLVVCEDTREAAIIDAQETDPIVLRVDALDVRVTKILSTHHHPDHTAGNPELAAIYDVPVYGHSSDADRIPGFTNGLEEGDRIEVGRCAAEVLFIPAHTRAHIAYFFGEDGALFCGDTLFVGGCGRLFEGTAEMMFEALCKKIAKLPDETRVYCGHEYTQSNLLFAKHVEPENSDVSERLAEVGQIRAKAAADWHDAKPDEMTIPSTLGDERRWNPFLRAADAGELGRIRTQKDNF